jgi:hypothetical protein
MILRTTIIAHLYRRTCYRAVTAINAAISILWFKYLFATITFIKELTGIGRHQFFLFISANRASDN